MNRGIFLAAVLLLSGSLGNSTRAQSSPVLTDARVFSDSELDQLLGPIALYPDPLIAQLLPAATQPSEIVMADRYVQTGGDPNQIEAQPWSAGVKAITHYQDLIKWLDDNLDWTTQVGQAFLYQSDQVMNSIQRLRAQAQSLGNLQTSPQQMIEVDNGNIEIVPANPEVLYLPVYQPAVVYTQAPSIGLAPFITFGGALSIGLWLNHDWDWDHRRIVVWDREHSRPRDWWYRPARERFVPSVTHDFHDWRPRSRINVSPVTREDRGWEVRSPRPEPTRVIENRVPANRVVENHVPANRVVENRTFPARPVENRPRGEETARRTEPVREVQRPIPAARQVEPRREPAPVARQPQFPTIQPHAAPTPAPARPNGALVGAGSPRDARDFSNRGQTSRSVPPGTGGPHPSGGPERNRH